METIAMIEGTKVKFYTKQFGNGITIDSKPAVPGLWSASFDDEKTWHTKFRKKLVDEGYKIIGGEVIEGAINADNKFNKL